MSSIYFLVIYEPPRLLSILNVSYDSVKMNVIIAERLVEHQLVSFLKFNIQGGSGNFFFLFPVKGIQTQVVLKTLEQGTNYRIQSATGNGTVFGDMGQEMYITTKGIIEFI